MDSNALKAKGNAYFQKSSFEEAVKYYGQAIKIDPNNHVLYSNRSVAYYMLGSFDKALEDANMGISKESTWPKNYARKADALYALQRYDEIAKVIEEGTKYVVAKSPEEQMFNEVAEKAKRQSETEKYYEKPLEPYAKSISVKYIDAKRGKGIFAQQPFSPNEIVFEEKPWMLLQKAENQRNVLACSHCLKFLGILKKEFHDAFKVFLSPPYKTKCDHLVQEPVTCVRGCNEVYCSEACSKEALEKYHELLCPGSNPSPSDPIIQFIQHAQETFYRFMLIARIISSIIQSARVSNDFDKSMIYLSQFCKEPWTTISHYDTASQMFEHEQIKDFQSIKEELQSKSLELLKATKVYDASYPSLFTLSFYTNTAGLIELNSATIENLPDRDTRRLLAKLYSIPQDDVPFSSGIGLFTIHSCLNHSCRPNSEVIGGIREISDARVKVVCLKPIKKGEEVTISYIELFRKTRDIRQKELKGGYQFDCSCTKCQQDKNKE